jgi:hypothetical protein
MRTKSMILGAAILAAGVATSMAQSNVYSVNVVGYVNRVIPGSGGFALVSNPLDTGNNVYSNLFQTLPVGSVVLKWSGSAFAPATRIAFGTGWSPSTNNLNTLNPGDAAFIQSPPSSGPITNTFVGSVVQGTWTNSFPAGFILLGNQSPDTGDFTSLGITAAVPSSPSGSQVLLWNETNQAYAPYTRIGFGAGWSPAGPAITTPGQGMFFDTVNPGSWSRTFTVN